MATGDRGVGIPKINVLFTRSRDQYQLFFSLSCQLGKLTRWHTYSGNIWPAGSMGKNCNTCKQKVYFFSIRMRPVSRNILSVVTAVYVVESAYTENPDTNENQGFFNRQEGWKPCWYNVFGVFFLSVNKRRILVNTADAIVVDGGTKWWFLLWKEVANLSRFSKSYKCITSTPVVRMRGTHKKIQEPLL